jgi:TolB-like protein/Tfp pilus assembly protein PilF
VTDTPTEGGGEGPWAKLRRRKVVEWGIAYAAGAWGVLQGVAYVTATFHWPEQIQQLATVALLIGLPIVLVVAWYHGDRGQQRLSAPELTILTLLFLMGGGIFWLYQRSADTPTTAATPAAATDSRPSIAVLPFENRSDLQKDALFVEGIHDDILTQLSKIGALKVISRTSVEQFRDTKLPTKTIAAQLGVRSILDGGVQRAGDRVRINVQLIDASTDAHVWAESYDRELTAANIFAIQSEVAAAIAGELKATLTTSEKARVHAVPTRSLEAWEAYQLGRQRLAKRTSTGLIEAEKSFRRAIELDPTFAPAYSGLADSLSLRVDYTDAPIDATLRQAQTAVDSALKLEPELADGWASSGLIATYRRQYAEAEQMFRHAIELNPNNAMTFKWYANLLDRTGRSDDELRNLERAAILDPLSAIIQQNIAGSLAEKGNFVDAASRYRRAIEIDPSLPAAYEGLAGLTAYALNRFAEAVPIGQTAAELDQGSPGPSLTLANLYFDLGDDQKYFGAIAQAEKRWSDDPLVQTSVAFAGMYRGDSAAAVRHAQQAPARYERNFGALLILRNADLQSRRYDDAVARYQTAYPELFSGEFPKVNDRNYWLAIDLSLPLQMRGDRERARLLLDAAERAISKISRLGYFGYGTSDVEIFALRSEHAKALSALREAERAGWRRGWRYQRSFNPNLASIRNSPEFEAVFADIERDMARQRAALAARPKDAPRDLAPIR